MNSRVDATYKPITILSLFILVSVELISRNLYSFYELYAIKVSSNSEKNASGDSFKKNRSFRKIILIIFSNIIILPNFVLLFPIVYLLDMVYGTNLSLYYFIIKASVMLILATLSVVKWVKSSLYVQLSNNI